MWASSRARIWSSFAKVIIGVVIVSTLYRTPTSSLLANLASTLALRALLGSAPGSDFERWARASLQIQDNSSAWLALARGYLIQRNSRQAEIAYRNALSLRQRDAGTWFVLGNLYEESGDHASALAAWRSADSEQYFRLRGLEYWTTKQYTEAFQVLFLGQQVYPESVSIAFEIGNVYKATGDLDRAIAAYELANRLANSCTSLLQLGELYYLQRQPVLARQRFEACAKSPNAGPAERADAYYGQATVALWLDNNQVEGEKLIELTLQANPVHVPALTRRGESELRAGQAAQALKTFEYVLHIGNSIDAYVQAMAGIAWSKVNGMCLETVTPVWQTAGEMVTGTTSPIVAARVFAQAVELCPMNDHYMRSYVFSYLWSADVTGAQMAAREVLRLSPQADWAREFLAETNAVLDK